MSTATTASRRTKDLFGDCALVEIIHLHDCFRGALRALEVDVGELHREIFEKAASNSATVTTSTAGEKHSDKIIDLERRVAGRFTVIWSVFRAHSAAEDEFIWPALKAKQVSLPEGCSPCGSPVHDADRGDVDIIQRETGGDAAADQHVGVQGVIQERPQNRERNNSMTVHHIEQEEYEEDHADEERMFNSINELLSKLRVELLKDKSGSEHDSELQHAAQMLLDGTKKLMMHLLIHLDKEETHCMPLVAQYLTKSEINDLVGKIMGKRSSELMSQILTMAVQNLNESDRDDMVRYMKQAMVGTFFERWLKMGGWIGNVESDESDDRGNKMSSKRLKTENVVANATSSGHEHGSDEQTRDDTKPAVTTATSAAVAMSAHQNSTDDLPCSCCCTAAKTVIDTSDKPTSAAELEKLIRAIGTNPNLDSQQKNQTIQGLRDSVWKSNCRVSKRKREEGGDGAFIDQQFVQPSPAATTTTGPSNRHEATTRQHLQTHHLSFSISQGLGTRFKRETPPSSYWEKSADGEVKLVWSSDPNSTKKYHPAVPLFSASELAQTYHDGGLNRILGCPHYARSCKLRHPTSGKLYTCRLCCEQSREMATQDKDSPLDRYEVKEILCMRCNALQPASEACVNPECESRGKPFSRYTCKICNFYDDTPNKAIYHCPFCNVCRSGQGLGVDYRHCMRCNACVSLTDEHQCIPQRLQGNCPICHESMFESTEPLRGMKCGHVMHLSCFTAYMRGTNYTCPLCKKSADDMTEYFALLDSAVRMQPMPPAYAATTSNIYCQDCGKMGNVSYHFVGLKCCHCASYNTRELQRVDANIMANLYGNRMN